jgi:hypothetical protein
MLKEMVAVVAIGMDAVVVEDQVAEAVLVVVAVADQAEAVVLVVEAGQAEVVQGLAEVVTEAEVVVLVVGTEKVVLEAVSAGEIPSLLTREGTKAPSRDKNCSNKA